MKSLKIVLFGIIVCFNTSACYQDSLIDDPFVENEKAPDDLIVLTNYAIAGNEIIKIRDFKVDESFLDYQTNVQQHEFLWEHYTALIPIAFRSRITEFEIIYGYGDIAGYVEPLDENDLSKWKLGLAIDVVSNQNNADIRKDIQYTIIHEYAHVLCFNESQMDLISEADCNNFYTEEGCAKSNSYIQSLFNLGWGKIYDEFESIRNDRQSDQFYEKYQSYFVTDYASTNPGEDFAESFTHFIINETLSMGTSIANQKVNLFYKYPELVDFRKQLRSGNEFQGKRMQQLITMANSVK